MVLHNKYVWLGNDYHVSNNTHKYLGTIILVYIGVCIG